MMEWEEEAEQKEEEEEEAGCVEEACAWGGSVIGSLGGCRVMSEDVDMDGRGETIDMIVDAECRRTIVKPRAFKGMKVKKVEDVGEEFPCSKWSTYSQPRRDDHCRQG